MDSRETMKILYLVPGFDEGGAEFHVLNLIRELSKRGHDITLASSGGHLEQELPRNVHTIHLPIWRKNLLVIAYCALRLSKLGRWDIIHAHSRVPAWVAWFLARLSGTCWVMTAHALYSHNPGLIPFRHADGMICVSEAVRHDLIDYLPANTITIPNGITPNKFKHRGSNDGTTRFLFAGRLTRLKGLDVVLSAAANLDCREWTLDVLGDGPQRAELEDMARSLGLGDQAKFHGAVSNDDVKEFMASSSCLVFPSYSEGMGLVVLEALSMGLPVIASDLEALRDFAEGDLIPPGDVSEWHEALQKFLDTGTASPLSAENIITVDEMACRVESFYLSLM